MKISEARYKANKAYDKKTYKQVIVRIRKEDKEILDWLDSQESKSAYLLSLAKEDMQKKKATK